MLRSLLSAVNIFSRAEIIMWIESIMFCLIVAVFGSNYMASTVAATGETHIFPASEPLALSARPFLSGLDPGTTQFWRTRFSLEAPGQHLAETFP